MKSSARCLITVRLVLVTQAVISKVVSIHFARGGGRYEQEHNSRTDTFCVLHHVLLASCSIIMIIENSSTDRSIS